MKYAVSTEWFTTSHPNHPALSSGSDVIIKFFRTVFSYWVIALICVLFSFISIPFLQGTNTGEDFCVYTVEGREGTYVRNGNGYELYDSQKHVDIKRTYIKRGASKKEEYFVNKPNWNFMDKDCVLRKESIFTFVIGYLISFTLLFVIFGSVRFVLGQIFNFCVVKLLRMKMD